MRSIFISAAVAMTVHCIDQSSAKLSSNQFLNTLLNVQASSKDFHLDTDEWLTSGKLLIGDQY